MTAPHLPRVWGRLIWVIVGDVIHLELGGRPLEQGERLHVWDASQGERLLVEVQRKDVDGYYVQYQVLLLDPETGGRTRRLGRILEELDLCARVT